MLLHKSNHQSSPLYTLFDSEERVVEHASYYLQHLRNRGRSQASQLHIANILNYFHRWIEETHYYPGLDVDKAIMCVDEDVIIDWINYQRRAGVSNKTIHNREVLLRQFYKWLTSAASGRLLNEIPWIEGSITKSHTKCLPKYVTVEQVITLLNGFHNESQRTAAHFIYDVGVRVSELSRITNRYLPNESDWPADINYYPIIIPGSKARGRDAIKVRESIITRSMLARINRYQSTPEYLLAKKWSIFDPDKPVFLNVHGEELTCDSIYKGLKDAWARQGRRADEISPHILRHGTAYSVLSGEVGKTLLDRLLLLKGMLGHENISTTEIYASIPVVVLQSLSGDKQARARYEDAHLIYESTYLNRHRHSERRGHTR